MDPIIKKAYEASLKQQSFAFATVIDSTLKGTPQKSGAKMVVLADGTIYGTIGGGRNEKAAQKECLKALKTQKPKVITYNFFGGKDQSVCGGQIEVLIEPFGGSKTFIICGAGHIALPLSILGKLLNFSVTIIDDRKIFANKKRFPHVDKIIVGPHAGKLAQVKITPETLIMIVTQGNEFDYKCLETVVRKDAGYIGVISSRAKRIKFLKRLRQKGVPEKYIKRLHIPAGIDIGAQTPEEIALSIASEIVATTNAGSLGTEKFKEKKKFSRKDNA